MKDWLDSQNLFLFVPFILAAGGATYFTWPYEPNIFLVTVAAVLFAAVAIWARIPKLCRGIAIFMFGFCYAAMFTHLVDTPTISRNLYDINITGTVQNIDFADTKTRIYLKINADDINAGNGYANVKLTVPDEVNIPGIGDTIWTTATLFKPSIASAPETFDYARWAYFNNLTATGYITSIQRIEQQHKPSISKLRTTIHDTTNSFLVDSLVLGYKNAVPKNDNTIWTTSGVGHVWSISGFHMTLVGGWLFIVFCILCKCVPYMTRRIPAKIPATIFAWCGLLFYLFLSGTDVATVRAFLMTTFVFAALIFGRSAISIRNVAIVFCCMFLTNPHCIMQVGFQLSFAAVYGMVWLYSEQKPKMPNNKILKIIWATILTSVIATVFTTPFIATHFGSVPVYGLIGNLIILPMFSVIIMPLTIIGTITAFLGFHTPIAIAENVYDFTLRCAEQISELPIASITVPHVSNGALVCFIAGAICLILIQSVRIKLNWILFTVLVAMGIFIVYQTPKPIFYTTCDNELAGFVMPDGELLFNKSRASKHYFAFNTWKQMNGNITDTPNKRFKHEDGVYRHNNIVYIQKFVPLMKNIKSLCNDDSVRYIVPYFDIKSKQCEHKILRGGFVVYPSGRIKYTIQNRRWHQ